MEENKKCDVLHCKITKAIDIIKSKYSVVLLLSLNNEEKNFTALAEEFNYLTNMQLTRTVNLLKDNNIILKENNIYKLTSIGKKLIPTILSLEEWAIDNL